MESSTYSSKTLDHLGLVAGMCREIGASEVIIRVMKRKVQTRS